MTVASALLKFPALIALAAAAAGQPPAAVVEDVTGNPAGVQLMDYVVPGETIKLGPHDSIVLGYLTSCSRETITGGTVTVGKDQSEVVGGEVQRHTIPCQGGKMQLTAQLADKSGAMAIREVPRGWVRPLEPQMTVYGRSPIVEVKPIGALVIERLDHPGEKLDIILPDAHLLQGKFLDLAADDVSLAPGGIYKVRVGVQEIIFKVDPNAQAGHTPVAGRLIRLQTN